MGQHMEQEQYPGLQMSEDMLQQKREWAVQRIAWVVLYALLIAIALGLTGKGVLSDASVGSPETAIQMKYDRFMRWHAPNDLRLTVQPSSSSVRIMLDSQYVRQVEIKKITPTPERTISAGDAMIFVFNADPSDPLHAEFQIRPETIGRLTGWVAVDGKQRHAFSQVVYP
jgi:hypothetical protein